MNKTLTKQDKEEIQKIVEEDKKAFFLEKQLTLKLSASQMKKALLKDAETGEPTAEFVPTWYSFLNNYRKYRVNKVEDFKLVLDDSAPDALRTTFEKAWRLFFKQQIVETSDDLKSSNRKIRLYSIFGSLIILIVVCSYLVSILLGQRLDPTSGAYTTLVIITTFICYGIYVFGWGMLWDMFTNIFGEHKRYKEKMRNLLLLYKAKIEYIPFSN